MGYATKIGEHRPLIDPATSAPIATAAVTDPSGNPPPFTTAVASIRDDGTGHLECVGTGVGIQTFALKSGGTVASHDVTVTAAPFDWTLGDPA